MRSVREKVAAVDVLCLPVYSNIISPNLAIVVDMGLRMFTTSNRDRHCISRSEMDRNRVRYIRQFVFLYHLEYPMDI